MEADSPAEGLPVLRLTVSTDFGAAPGSMLSLSWWRAPAMSTANKPCVRHREVSSATRGRLTGAAVDYDAYSRKINCVAPI